MGWHFGTNEPCCVVNTNNMACLDGLVGRYSAIERQHGILACPTVVSQPWPPLFMASFVGSLPIRSHSHNYRVLCCVYLTLEPNLVTSCHHGAHSFGLDDSLLLPLLTTSHYIRLFSCLYFMCALSVCLLVFGACFVLPCTVHTWYLSLSLRRILYLQYGSVRTAAVPLVVVRK
jgi:hypothetical protein